MAKGPKSRGAPYGGAPASPRPNPPRPASSRGAGANDRWYARGLRRRLLSALLCVVAAVLGGRAALLTAWGQASDTLFMEAAARWADRLGPVVDVVTSLVSVPAMGVVGVLVLVVAVARRRPTLAGRAIVAAAGANATTQIVKALLDRPDLGVTTALSNSLPSGHTTFAMSVALAAVMVAPQWGRGPSAVLGWAWTSLMGVSVMISQWHRLADVLAAFLVCGAWALALAPIEGRERQAPRASGAMAIAALGFCGLALVVSVLALYSLDASAVARPGASGYGFAAFLESAPWRARLLAAAAFSWVVGVSGWVIHEVDVLCVDRR